MDDEGIGFVKDGYQKAYKKIKEVLKAPQEIELTEDEFTSLMAYLPAFDRVIVPNRNNAIQVGLFGPIVIFKE